MKTHIQLSILIAFFLVTSCMHDETEEVLRTGSNGIGVKQDSPRPIILGKKLSNPFSVENMRAALDTLRKHPGQLDNCLKSPDAIEEIVIQPTDLYVCFKPCDSTQYWALRNDTTLMLYDYPLDYEIIQDGEYLINPQQSTGYPTLYTRVPVGYVNASKVPYEIIDELFLYENSPEYSEEIVGNQSLPQKRSLVSRESIIDAFKTIEAVSFINTGNPYGEEELSRRSQSGVQLRKVIVVKKKFLWHEWYENEYYPSGTLTVQSYHTMDVNGQTRQFNALTAVPLKGIKVHFINWFRWCSTYTDQNGYYESPEYFSGDPTYSIYFSGKNQGNSWDLDRVALWTLCLWVQKYGLGEHDKNGYTTTINANSSAWPACITNNAFYEYMTITDRDGLTRPSSNLKVALRKMDGASSAPLLQNHEDLWSNSTMTILMGSSFFNGGTGILAASAYALLAKSFPDIILSGGELNSSSDTLRNYYSTTWHELTHASFYKKFENKKGRTDAGLYWSFVISTEISKGWLSPDFRFYGEKDDFDWERIAICEGWAYYRQRELSLGSLNNYDPLSLTSWMFPRDYFPLFHQLRDMGCQLNVLESCICTHKIADFKKELISCYPELANRITSAFSSYE